MCHQLTDRASDTRTLDWGLTGQEGGAGALGWLVWLDAVDLGVVCLCFLLVLSAGDEKKKHSN